MKIEIEINILEVVGSNPHETSAMLDSWFDFFCASSWNKPFHRPPSSRYNFWWLWNGFSYHFQISFSSKKKPQKFGSAERNNWYFVGWFCDCILFYCFGFVGHRLRCRQTQNNWYFCERKSQQFTRNWIHDVFLLACKEKKEK